MLKTIFIFICSGIFLSFGYFLYNALNFLDKPKLYGFNRKAVPYGFGLVLFVLFSIIALVFNPLSIKLLALLFSLIVLSFTCFIDDRISLHPIIRLGIQTVCAFVVVTNGISVLEVSNPFGIDNFILGDFGILISVFWILLLTNIMNFLDGVSGLTSGVSSVGFFILFILSLDTNLHLVDQSLLTSLSLIASIIAFVGFVLELPLLNPKVLLGDAGSMPMGFLLASLSMINGGKLATLGIVLLIPLFDGVFVILYRLYKGRSPLIGDQNHLHHKLLDKGFSRLQIISLYFVVTLVFGLMAIYAWNTYLKLLTFVFAAIVLTVFFYLTWNVNGYQRRN